ncbi:GntR family transcriptional regulator [Salmonella enterica subsp. enterica]|uniref:GntR family transcriptional regulator n=1 Tax=Salmonella enterica I TaxID=59201 RepID=A0A379WMF3_SALET|nr:GntR family transcriptional regulator [Salmonella enterica subsp. enterica]
MKQSAELWRAVRTENPRWKQLNYKYLHKKELRMKWVEDHRSIFLALQKRDAEQARQASWTHLENSKNELVKIFQQDDSLEDFDDFFLRHLTAIFRRMTFLSAINRACRQKQARREGIRLRKRSAYPSQTLRQCRSVWCHGAIIVDHQRMFGILIDRETVNLQSASLECGNQSDV